MEIGSLLAAIGVLAVVILVHELGHFFVAKWCDVEVLCFSIGFGPTLWSRTYGETEYRIGLVPVGGYVRMAGQDDDEMSEEAPSDPTRGFTAKSVSQRGAILAAGPLVNLGFAVLIFTVVAYCYGMQLPSEKPLVGGVIPGTPAEAAGLAVDERVVSIDGEAVSTWPELAERAMASKGAPLDFELVAPDGATRTVTVTPELRPERDAFGEVTGQVYKIGIERPFETHEVGLLGAVGIGFRYTYYYSKMVVRTVGRLVQGRLAARDIGGPILIAQVASRKAQRGFESLLAFVALISVNLGILNLLPIPVLDGGHLAFLGFEALRGKPLSLRVRETALQAGFVLIGFLMIFVVFNDIFRIIAG